MDTLDIPVTRIFVSNLRHLKLRVKGADLQDVNPQALLGVPDAMSVSNLAEASLLHTIRERYSREQVSREWHWHASR